MQYIASTLNLFGFEVTLVFWPETGNYNFTSVPSATPAQQLKIAKYLKDEGFLDIPPKAPVMES